MAQNQLSVIVPSLVKVVLGCFLLTTVLGVSEEFGDGVVILTRSSSDPPPGFVTAVEGGTLVLHCSVSTDTLEQVWWGKDSESGDVYLTENKGTLTNDSRVLISRSTNFTWDNIDYRNYTIQITQITASDAGVYFCLTQWKFNTYLKTRGELNVSVTLFQNGNPKCWSTCDYINGTLVWCGTEHAYPGGNITWTVEETGQVVSITGADMSMDASGRKWVQSSYQVNPELQNQVLICTIKSSVFPGRNQTCSIMPLVETESTSECLETTSVNGPLLTSTSATSITESPLDVVTVSAAVAIPSFTLLLVAFLLCVLKRRRRQPGRGKDSGTMTDGIESKCDAGMTCEVIAHPVTQMPHHGSEGTTGATRNTFDPSYEEVELDHPASRSTTSLEAQGKDGLGQGTCVIHHTVHPDDRDCDASSWETDNLHQERINSDDNNVVTGGDGDKSEVSHVGSVECDERMVDNPIYHSYDDEQPSHQN